MGWFDGFPFTNNEERERRRKDFEKRIAPFGVDEQREKLKATLGGLFPKINTTDAMFAFYDAKDAFTKKDTVEEGRDAARLKLRKLSWIDGQSEAVLLRFIELENKITSLDDYPTANDVLSGLYDEA